MRFYRIDWPARGASDKCSDWSTSWDEAHRIGRGQSDYYKVTLVELPDRKGGMLQFLRDNVRGNPSTASQTERRDFGADRAP